MEILIGAPWPGNIRVYEIDSSGWVPLGVPRGVHVFMQANAIRWRGIRIRCRESI